MEFLYNMGRGTRLWDRGEVIPYNAMTRFFGKSDEDDSCTIDLNEFQRAVDALQKGAVDGINAINLLA